MSNHFSGVCSPIRDKRRQSDAKWRASVATCYDVLKYVVPNVKNMSKKKISKALILQECEKHIQELEDTISYLFHVECKKQGQIALWKEGDYWSQCSMEKLHEDFTEKQRKVFLVSSHGRRCYNLLQDIKDEVFDMRADSKQMAFVGEDSLSLMNNSEEVNDSMMGAHTVTVLPFSVDNMNELVVSEISQTAPDQSQSATGSDSQSKNQEGLQHVPSNSISWTNRAQVRQQPRPRQRFFSDNERDIDTALLQGLEDGERVNGMATHVQSCESACLLSAGSDASEKQHIVHGVIGASPTTVLGTTTAVSASHETRCKSENASNTDQSGDVLGNGDNHRLKSENQTGNLCDLSKEKDYPFLLGALKAETEQEVPTTPLKTSKIKRPRLSSDSTDIDFLHDYGGGHSKEIDCVSEHDSCTDSFLACDGMYSKCYPSHSVGSKISTLTVGAANSFNSLVNSCKSDVKVETEDSSPCINYDPLLSSLNTPKFDTDMSLFLWTPNDGVTKRPPKYGSARKKLNFNSPSFSGWSITSPRLLHTDRAVPASVVTGFTPVKLPDDLTRNSDASSEYLTSPWKSVNSPFNCRTMPQGYMNSSALVDLEDNLFCMETLDALDFEEGLTNEVTPAPALSVENIRQPDALLKEKASLVHGEPSSRVKPPCRRKLEGFYDQLMTARDFTSLSDESHVVPQLDMTLWTSVAADFRRHLDRRAAVDAEDSLLCLETGDALELDCVDS